MSNEADTCRRYVLPKLYEAGWTDDQISEQKYFTDGRIIPVGRKHRRRPGKKTDYLLAYRPDFPIAVVEAKADYKLPGDGLQQSMAYAEVLDLRFAYSTNGHGIVEHAFTTGKQSGLSAFPSPEALWKRLRGGGAGRRQGGRGPELPVQSGASFRSSQRHSSARPDPADKLPQLL